MEILEITTSSAISRITFNQEDNLVGISFTYSPKKEYLFYCESNMDEIKSKILMVDSVGKLVNKFRKDGTFKPVEIEKN